MPFLFKKPVNIWITIGAAVLTVVVIALIVWGVTHHTEGGLLCVRWHNGAAVYLDQEECDGARQGAEKLVWPSEEVPLTVLLEADHPDENVGEGSQADRVSAQIERDINAQVGCRLVKRVASEPRSGADLWLHWGASYESSDASRRSTQGDRRGAENSAAPEWTVHRGQGAPVEAHVTVRGGLSDRAAYMVAFHGILHGIGLAHDPDYPSSPMYPLTRDDTDDDLMRPMRITDHDVELLRELYCGGQ